MHYLRTKILCLYLLIIQKKCEENNNILLHIIRC